MEVFMEEIKYYSVKNQNIEELKVAKDTRHARKEHLHEELTVGIAESGMSNISMNGEIYEIKAGDLFFIGSLISHSCNPVEPKEWTYTMIYIKQSHVTEIFNKEDMSDIVAVKRLNSNQIVELKRLIERIKEADFSKEESSYLDDILYQYYLKADRKQKFEIESELLEVKKYIESHFTEEFNMENLADIFDIDIYTLIKRYKKYHKTTPIAYKTQLRLDFAKQKLTGNQKIGDIAVDAGFYDQAHFSKLFKEIYGITPNAYRKNRKQNS
jgi:AraC-like DNA-binding protein